MRSLQLVAVQFFLPTALSASGSFSFLTFNVAGLPAILNGNGEGDKQANSQLIGQYLAANNPDIAHLQEDFNYHAYIYATDDHPYRTATSGGVPFGSGLNTIADYDWSEYSRTKWDECYINEADCLTPKGYSFMRMQIASGVEVDLYNLHADAGTEDGDLLARRSNIKQVADAIDANSAGRAVVVGGDTNTRYTRTDDNIRLLSTQNDLTDAWVQLEKAGTPPAQGAADLVCENPSTTTSCEIVDKVFYRSGDSVNLTASSFAYVSNDYLDADGNPLSDHNPVLVEFSYSV